MGAGIAAVELDDELSAGNPRIRRAAGVDRLPLPGWIEIKLRVLVHAALQTVEGDLAGLPFDRAAVLALYEPVVDGVGHQDLGQPDRLSGLFVVFHGNLPLAVRCKNRVAAGFEGAHHPVDKDKREREQLRRLVAGETVHDPLIAGADLFVFSRIGACADVDVGRLGDYGVENAEGVAVQADRRVVVADTENRLPDALVQIDPGPCADLAPDNAEPFAEEDLDAAVRHGVDIHPLPVLAVENGGDDVGCNRIRDDVRMPHFDAFR